MPVPEEYSQRRPPDELLCLTPEAIQEFRPRPLHELAAEVGARRASEARRRLAGLSPEERRQRLRRDWARLLGDVEPEGRTEDPEATRKRPRSTRPSSASPWKWSGASSSPSCCSSRRPGRRHARPVVLAAGPGGQASLPGTAVGVDRGTGSAAGRRSAWSTCEGPARRGPATVRGGTTGASTAVSAAEWMLGQTLVGSRLRDVRSVLRYLRTRADLDAGRVALWGDSFAPPNPEGRVLAVPLDADPFPHLAEPLGGLLALFGGPVRGRRPRRLRARRPDGLRVAPAKPVLLRAARRPGPRGPDRGRPLRRGGVRWRLARCGWRAWSTASTARSSPSRLARIMEPARSAYRALDAGTASGSGSGTMPLRRAGCWSSCSRIDEGPIIGPAAQASQPVRLRVTTQLSRSTEPLSTGYR